MRNIYFPSLTYESVAVHTEPPEPGDLRIVQNTRVYPNTWRVEWFGQLVGRGERGPGTLKWRPSTWGQNCDGIFPTFEDAKEAILGPRVTAYYRRSPEGPAKVTARDAS